MIPYSLSPALADRIARALGRRPTACFTFAGGGYTPALRLLLGFEGGGSAFAKVATSPDTAAWLRAEMRAYDALSGASFLPAVLGANPGDVGDSDCPPFLILEDLHDAHWPPPWNDARIEAVLAALAEVRASAHRMPEAPRLEAVREELCSWNRVAADPTPFLSLGLCTPAWLDTGLPALLAADRAVTLDGDDLLHGDIRSDNLCFRPDGRAVFVDWNFACIGSGVFDLAFFLPSLQSEGGPSPETILPDPVDGAVIAAGYFAARAGLPIVPHAPRVRDVQKTQLATALPWAARVLGLPPPAPRP